MIKLDFDTAKRLKHAGYPQPRASFRYDGEFLTQDGDPEVVYAPMLEEVMDACGPSFEYLRQIEGKWYAASFGESKSIFTMTPHPAAVYAAADLWLRLNPPVASNTTTDHWAPSPCSDPELTHDCSGCTDPHSEGTHAGCTKQHGHVGCTLAKPGDYSFKR